MAALSPQTTALVLAGLVLVAVGATGLARRPAPPPPPTAATPAPRPTERDTRTATPRAISPDDFPAEIPLDLRRDLAETASAVLDGSYHPPTVAPGTPPHLWPITPRPAPCPGRGTLGHRHVERPTAAATPTETRRSP